MSATWTGSAAIGGYSLQRLLARGGMGSVYLARTPSGHPVAIKVLHESFRDDATFVARFKREADLQRTLEHPHIVPVLASGESEMGPYIVMRMIDGPSLRAMIRAQALEALQAIALLGGIASALDHAHARGVLHRDVKPHNILVEHGSHAWLADFGLTRAVQDTSGLTTTGGLLGTFDYLAPEIARGEPATAAGDVYAFAVTIFQALTGSLPFPTENQAAAVLAHAGAPRPRASERAPALPAAVDDVLQSGMALAPLDRPASAGALLDGVRVAFGLEPCAAHARPESATSAPTVTSVADGALSVAGRGGQGQGQAHVSAGGQAHVSTGGQARVSAGGRAHVSTGGRAPGRATRTRRRLLIAGGGLLVALAAVIAVLALNGGRAAPPPVTFTPLAETVGGLTHTWSDYADAGGRAGPSIATGTTVLIRCWVRGFKVDDGNRYWYRVASPPWSDAYYASADAFYNNGATSGRLRGTPFVDREVHAC